MNGHAHFLQDATLRDLDPRESALAWVLARLEQNRHIFLVLHTQTKYGLVILYVRHLNQSLKVYQSPKGYVRRTRMYDTNLNTKSRFKPH